jgi:hypothetical protein
VDATIQELQLRGKHVVLIGPVPSQPIAVPRLLALRGADAPTRSAAEFANSAHWFTRHYPQWRARGVGVIDPLKSLSADGRTIIVAGGTPLYYDSHHLILTGARRVLAGPDQ